MAWTAKARKVNAERDGEPRKRYPSDYRPGRKRGPTPDTHSSSCEYAGSDIGPECLAFIQAVLAKQQAVGGRGKLMFSHIFDTVKALGYTRATEFVGQHKGRG